MTVFIKVVRELLVAYAVFLAESKSPSTNIDRANEALSCYEKYFRQGFIDSHCSLFSCGSSASSRDCEVVLYRPNSRKTSSENDRYTPVTCSCNHSFCFNCGVEEQHFPIKCSVLREFNNKADDFLQQILSLDKFQLCPKCSIGIEKTEGCNHMRCTNCKYEFCWICLQECPRHLHPKGGCNKVEKGMNAEQIFNHYLKRFKIHANSEKLEIIATMKQKNLDIMSEDLVITNYYELSWLFLMQIFEIGLR